MRLKTVSLTGWSAWDTGGRRVKRAQTRGTTRSRVCIFTGSGREDGDCQVVSLTTEEAEVVIRSGVLRRRLLLTSGMNCPFIPVTRTRRGRPAGYRGCFRILEAERLELDELNRAR